MVHIMFLYSEFDFTAKSLITKNCRYNEGPLYFFVIPQCYSVRIYIVSCIGITQVAALLLSGLFVLYFKIENTVKTEVAVF